MKLPTITRRQILLLTLVGGMLSLVVPLGLAHYTTTNPDYCLNCHATKETPDIGKLSKVHPDYHQVACVQCHTGADHNLVADGYRGGFTADPQRVSYNCLRCHQDAAQRESVELVNDTVHIQLPHQFHIENVEAQCTDCHNNIAHDFRRVATNRPPMDNCLQCHSAASDDSCQTCHLSPLPSPPSPVTSS